MEKGWKEPLTSRSKKSSPEKEKLGVLTGYHWWPRIIQDYQIFQVFYVDTRVIFNNLRLKQVTMEPTKLAVRRTHNPNNSLVRVRLQNKEDAPLIDLCGGCGRSSCQLCTLMENAVSVVSASIGREHLMRCCEDANCKETMVVYCLTCSVCVLQYVGQTENLRKRLNNFVIH